MEASEFVGLNRRRPASVVKLHLGALGGHYLADQVTCFRDFQLESQFAAFESELTLQRRPAPDGGEQIGVQVRVIDERGRLVIDRPGPAGEGSFPRQIDGVGPLAYIEGLEATRDRLPGCSLVFWSHVTVPSGDICVAATLGSVPTGTTPLLSTVNLLVTRLERRAGKVETLVVDRLAVVGAGVVGLAVAHRLQQANPTSSVVVIEREKAVGTHQSGHNSGVIHSGLYYTPGSLKAELCVSGGEMLKRYCAERSIAVEQCGKLVVALQASELARLHSLYERGLANGVPGLSLLEGDDLREFEPHVTGLGAIHSPSTSVVDYKAVTKALAAEIAVTGQIWLGTEVVSVLPQPGGLVRLDLAGEHSGHFDCDFAIVCAGLQSDRLAVRSGADAEPRIIPFRGSYYRLRPSARHLVRGLIYPVPDPRYPFLGIHLTNTVGGEVLVGPNAFVALSRNDNAGRAFDWQDVRETLAWPGFARFARDNWRAGAREMTHAMSRRGFASAVRRYIPEITAGDLEPAVAGIRAQAMLRDGSLVDDFWLEAREGVLDVRNAPSPAATAAFAIADHICRKAGLAA